MVSYNIHRCIGADGLYKPARIQQVIQQLQPSIIALQEVEQLKNNPDLLPIFCEDSDLSAIPGLTLSREDGHYGNALLTRFPVLDLQRFDISVTGREPRGAISAVLEIGGHHAHVIATHLGLRPGERFSQVKRLIEFIKQKAFNYPTISHTLLLGDFNEWWPWSRASTLLRNNLLSITTPATFPAQFPLFPLDKIWISPQSKIQINAYVRKDTLTRSVSDHLPVIADINLEKSL